MPGTKEIKLSKNQVAIVDEKDFEKLESLGKWTLHGEGYAYRWDRSVKPIKCMLMHRIIMNAPKGKDVDHINHNKLDNRRANLRIVSRSTNAHNREVQGSGYEESKHWNGYVARLHLNGARVYLGRFNNKEDAQMIFFSAKAQLADGGEL